MDSGITNSECVFKSITSKVEFVDIPDHYSFNEDLICKYTLTNYEVLEGDRIAIFKLGWNFVKECVLFEWVPLDDPDQQVTFNKSSLPKTIQEFYQFCFISGENHVLGASIPFQFCDKPKNHQSLCIKEISFQNDLKPMTNNFSTLSLNIENEAQNLEIQKIKDENKLLRNTLKAIVSQKTKNYDPDIQQLKKIMYDMQNMLNIQQIQIKDLQIKLQSFKLENDNKQRNNTTLKNNMDRPHAVKYPLEFELGELQSLPPFPFAK